MSVFFRVSQATEGLTENLECLDKRCNASFVASDAVKCCQ